MGWSQTHYAPARQVRRGPGVAHSRGIADIRSTFVATPKLRTVFVMNDELLRHGLMHVVSQATGVQFVGDLHHGAGLAERLRALRPELLVLGMDPGLRLAALLAELDSTPKVVVVVDGDDTAPHALDLIKAGADALIDRRSPSADLLNTVTRVIDGQTALDARSAAMLIAELRSPETDASADFSPMLTRREREVLSLLTDGLDNRAIAAKLFISEATVKFHLHNIMDKFGVHKRAALVSAALRGHRGGADGYPRAIHHA
jgi:DNA-binding NarL/FixJ family response regulator